MTINEKVKLLREEMGLNGLTTSRLIGINPNVLRFIEVGRNKPSADLIVKICKFFNVSADWLLGLKEERN